MHLEQGNIIKIFAGSTGGSFAKKMCKYLGTELGKSEVIHFSDGNIFVRVQETVRDHDVYLIQPIGLDPNNELVEILFWIDALKRASASSITVIIRISGMPRAIRRTSLGFPSAPESVRTASKPPGRTVLSPWIYTAHRFKVSSGSPWITCISCPFCARWSKGMGLSENLVVVSPDAGFAKTARKYADYLGTPVAIGDKTRAGHDEKAEILELIGNVEGKDCMIVDDFTISGGTLADIAHVLKQKGAKRILSCLGHNMLREKGVKRIDESPIEMLISTDTVENPYLAASKKMVTVSVAPLFAEAVLRIHERVSVSTLFNQVPSKVVEDAHPCAASEQK